jgi:hypothetical protein
MQLRLFAVRKGGMLTALAHLHYEAEQQVAAAEYEIANAMGDAPARETHRQQWLCWRDDLRSRADALGCDVKRLKITGKLNFATTAAEASQIGSYKTLYLRHSLAAHGSGSGTIYATLGTLVTEDGGMLLPLDANVVDSVGDALTQLFLSLLCAAEIIEDEELARDIHHALHHLQDAWAGLSPHLAS